ncbi:MAG: serine hydrolase domain-containing protein [Pseudomonadota bacterium]
MILSRRSMLGGLATSLASGAIAQAGGFAGSGAQNALTRAVADAARKAIGAKAVPGISVAVGRGRHMLLKRGYGFANLETRSAVTPASIFRIGSLTKQFTATAAARLHEQGRLRLDDPIAQYLPAFAKLPRIAISELIHHTAGLHSDDEGTSLPAGPAGFSTQVALANAIAAQKTVLDFVPGTAWLYSNSNYIVLGAIIEQASGAPFAKALADLVLKPLQPTTLAVDRSDIVVPGRASGYSLGEDGSFANAPYLEISDAGGAGAMRGAAADLVRWHQALIAGKVIGHEGLAFLTTPGRLRDGRLTSANRFSASDSNYGKVQYGGGLLLSPPCERPRTISHNGFINGFSALLETNFDSGVTFAVLANADVGPNLPFREIRRAVRAFEGAAGAELTAAKVGNRSAAP